MMANADGSLTSGAARRARARSEMLVLAAIAEDRRDARPLAGERIALCGHVTEATSVQVDTLRRLGAEVAWCASSTSTTDEAIKASLEEEGVFVRGARGMSEARLEEGVIAVRDRWPEGPTLVLDEGARLIRAFHAGDCATPAPRLAAEKTPEGIAVVSRMALRFPVLESDESIGKRLVDNPHGTSQSLIATILDVTQRLLAGRVFVVLGYGRVGTGLADKARGLGARVIVCETRATRALMAALAGFEIMPAALALREADVVCTVTGERGAVSGRDLEVLKNGAILVNGGHTPLEIDVAELAAKATERPFAPGMSAFDFPDRRTAYLVGGGHIANLSAGKGNPNEVMDVTFASQVMALLEAGRADLAPGLHGLPPEGEKAVARYVAGTLGLDVSALA